MHIFRAWKAKRPLRISATDTILAIYLLVVQSANRSYHLHIPRNHHFCWRSLTTRISNGAKISFRSNTEAPIGDKKVRPAIDLSILRHVCANHTLDLIQNIDCTFTRHADVSRRYQWAYGCNVVMERPASEVKRREPFSTKVSPANAMKGWISLCKVRDLR